MNRIIFVPAIIGGLLLALAGCSANNGPNPVPGGPDFNNPKAASAAIQKQIAGIQASGEPQGVKSQQIAQLQGLLNHTKPAMTSSTPSR